MPDWWAAWVDLHAFVRAHPAFRRALGPLCASGNAVTLMCEVRGVVRRVLQGEDTEEEDPGQRGKWADSGLGHTCYKLVPPTGSANFALQSDHSRALNARECVNLYGKRRRGAVERGACI